MLLVAQILPQLPGNKMNEFFDLVRPLVEFKFEHILIRSNNIFEVMTVEPIEVLLKGGGGAKKDGAGAGEGEEEEEPMVLGEEDEDKNLHLKGQMMFMGEWNVIMFLCAPSLPNFDALIASGLFINDLSMHDFSRDLLMASKGFPHQ